MNAFVEGCNHSHRHTGIGLNTPADGHYGLAAGKAVERAATLATPAAAWINRPAEPQEAEPKLAA